MNIPTSKKELIAALTKGSAKLRREIVEFLSINSKYKSKKSNLSKNRDNSIIDVTNESYTIPQPVKNQNIQSYNLDSSSQIKPKVSVPYWEHQYVYSFREIYDATKKQKEFYTYFKNRFLHQEFVELEDNTNYAFILLFDLLNEYENHKNVSILENQLRLLGQFYPKTNSYALSLLARKMEARGDFAGAERINYEYQLTYYDYWK